LEPSAASGYELMPISTVKLGYK